MIPTSRRASARKTGGKRRPTAKRIALLLCLLLAFTPCVYSLELPAPRKEGSVSVESAIFARQSVRDFAESPVSVAQIGQLLWAASGRTVDGLSGPTRAAPSAGGLYPVRSYVVVGNAGGIPAGVYAYDWREHALDQLASGDLRPDLREAALNQRAVGEAPCVVVLGVDSRVTLRKYGERGEDRYVYLDAGHAAQNVALQASALGLGTVTIGAFHDDRVGQLLDIDTAPVYLIPVGRPE